MQSVLAFLVVGAMAFVGARVSKVFRQRGTYAAHWVKQNKQAPKAGAIKIVALGDSIMQGIGASSPDDGLVGLATRYIQKATSRPVHVANYSRTGAKVQEVLETQVPLSDLSKADIILVAVSANDATKKTSLKDYEAALDSLLDLLPKDKTIVADVPGVRRRDDYQPILEEARKERKLLGADLVAVFSQVPRGTRLTAGDFFHPNNEGYRIWFAAFKPEIDKLLPQLKSKAR